MTTLSRGTGGIFLARMLRGHNVQTPSKLIFEGIINPPTKDLYKNGGDPAKSVLGVTGMRALEEMGLKAGNMRFVEVGDKLNLEIEVKK